MHPNGECERGAEFKLTDLFAECQAEVDAEQQESNLVIAYGELLGGECPKGLARAIAQLAGKAPEELFPECFIQKRQSSPKKPKVVDVPPDKCTNNHADMTIYVEKANPWYWKVEGRQFYNDACWECKAIIGGDNGTIKPSQKKPIHVCAEYALCKVDCQMMLCTPCFTKKVGKDTEKNTDGILNAKEDGSRPSRRSLLRK